MPPTAESVSRKKRKREDSSLDEVDHALLSRLEDLHKEQNGETAFGEHVAASLQLMTPRQRASARVEIDKVLLNIQFPEEPYTPNDPYYTFPC